MQFYPIRKEKEMQNQRKVIFCQLKFTGFGLPLKTMLLNAEW
jgi:hypothetical protein